MSKHHWGNPRGGLVMGLVFIAAGLLGILTPLGQKKSTVGLSGLFDTPLWFLGLLLILGGAIFCWTALSQIRGEK